MKHFIEKESETTVAGYKKIYDIFEKERHTCKFPKPHTHSYYELLLVTEGEQIYQIELSSHIKLHAGDILFVPPFIPHDTYRQNNKSMRCIVVKFSPTFLYPLETTPSDLNCLLNSPHYQQPCYVFRNGEKTAEELAAMLKKILTVLTGRKLGYEISLRGDLSTLYVWLLQNCGNDTTDQRSDLHLDIYDSQKFYHVLQFLRNNYQHNLSTQEMAEMCSMDYRQFSKFFKKVSGQNFNEYLSDMRLNYAQKMLLKGEDSISEIATKCGFEYVSYFIRKFKEKYNMTPNQYLKNYQLTAQTNHFQISE